MKKYTFIAEFRGGTYISQYKSKTLDDAMIKWSKGLSPEYFTESVKRKIIEKVKETDLSPVLLNGIDNAWCVSYTISRSFLLLNIIETV
jgi:hypothetical protein